MHNFRSMRPFIQILCLCFALSFSATGQVVDTAIHIKSIYFGGGNWYIDLGQEHQLYEWLDSFEHIEQFEIIIQSHTDNIGGVEYNKRLSEMRSNAVWERLVNHELQPEGIEVKDFGEYLPTYSNNNHAGRMHNRRVDVILKPLTL